LRAQNQLRERFSRDEWLLAAFEQMSGAQRREFLLRLKNTSGIPSMDRRSLMGKAVKRHPELEDVLAARTPRRQGAGPRGPVTSTRSYRARQEQLERLVNVEIPQNSKEIGVARSYGDLRENHEYKAAREMQGILLRRRAELEQMLNRVRPSDFRGRPADQAGPGTGILLRYPDGGTERYYILGEWDRDEHLHIISCESRLARSVTGRKPGDSVTVPAEDGDAACTLEEVTGLPEEVLQWIDGEGGESSSTAVAGGA
jgi:transcription elongation GreA/GreB family factor